MDTDVGGDAMDEEEDTNTTKKAMVSNFVNTVLLNKRMANASIFM